MEDNNTDGKRKITPENYISIRHLQERWINEKDRKRKEEEEKRGNQQVEKQQTIENDLKKTERARGQRDEEKRLDRSNRKNWGMNSRKKEPEITATIVSERSEDAAAPKKDRGFRRKRYRSKKKKHQDVDVVEDVVIDCRTGSIAPLPEVVVAEKITPVKDVIRVYRKKGKKATGMKSVEYREKNQDVAVVENVVVDSGCGSIAPPPEVVVTEKITPVKDVNRKKGGKATGKKSVEYRAKTVMVDAATAIETQFEDLSIKNGETKTLKAETRSSNRNRLNQGNDLVHQRVRRPIGAAASTMVWVKKE